MVDKVLDANGNPIVSSSDGAKPQLDATGNPVLDSEGKQVMQKTEVTDQVLKITMPDGSIKEVKSADIFDESGVPYRNRVGELQRRGKEVDDENVSLRTQLFQQGEEGPNKVKPKLDANGQPIVEDPEYTEDDINRMMMTGEGTKAIQYILKKAIPDPEKIVNNVLSKNSARNQAASKYPDLLNPQSEFFMRVAQVMNQNGLYNNPRGLSLAASQVESDLRTEGKEVNVVSIVSGAEQQRLSQGQPGVIPGGDGTRPPAGGKPELDQAGKDMAKKLGISEEKMAVRLAKHLEGRIR